MINNENTLSHDADIGIIRQCMHGNTDAFCSIVEKYQNLLFHVIYRMIGDRDDAADILQNVFIKAFEKLHMYNPRKNFRFWIHRIAVNESINFIHHRHRLINVIEERVIAIDDTPDVLLQKTELVDTIEKALLRLNTEHRILIILKHFGELSYRDISEILGISEKTVKSRLYSARQQLRKILININD